MHRSGIRRWHKRRVEGVFHAGLRKQFLSVFLRLMPELDTHFGGKVHHGFVKTVDGWVLLPVYIRIYVVRMGLGCRFFGFRIFRSHIFRLFAFSLLLRGNGRGSRRFIRNLRRNLCLFLAVLVL